MEQFQHGGAVSTWGEADIKCHQKSSAFKYIPFEQWRSQVNSLGGQNKVAPGRVEEVKHGVVPGDKLQNAGNARGRGIDLLLGSVSPLPPGKFYVL